MKTLLNSESVALFFDNGLQLTAEGVTLGGGFVNYDLNAGNATVIDVAPPQPALGGVWKWDGGTWVCLDLAAVDAYLQQQKDAYNAQQKERRAKAYTSEADPIFFKAQRGEATQQEWLDKVAEIAARYPYQS